MARVAVGLRFGAFLTFLLLVLSARAFDARGPAAVTSAAATSTDEQVVTDGGSIVSEGDMIPVALSALEEGIASGAGDRTRGRQAESEHSERDISAHADAQPSIELVVEATGLHGAQEHRPYLDEVMTCARRSAVDPPCASE